MELRVCHLYPDVLNLYGDRGNVLCIKKRLEWRGIGCTVTELPIGERRGLGNFDLFFVGGGQDFEQGLLLEDLRGTLDLAAAAGIARERIILDPGIGFAKSCEQNLTAMHRLDELAALGCPVLLAASRKSVIGLSLGLPVEERLEGTLATTAIGVLQGATFVRVHDVKENLRAARMALAIRREARLGEGA